ncbi:MAG: heavy-metal-associated domain-containing protein [Ruminococcaceae bacterium]|nr:heavy-metal-associated domain-containing protein [Oscillospiraceae bacterium]
MIKKYNMENVDCANCAAKMEEGIKKLEGVNDARVNFLTQKLVLDTEREDMDVLFDEVMKVCKKVDGDVEIDFQR